MMILLTAVAIAAVVAPLLVAFYRTGENPPLPEIAIFVGAVTSATLFPAVERDAWPVVLVQAPPGLLAAWFSMRLKRRAVTRD